MGISLNGVGQNPQLRKAEGTNILTACKTVCVAVVLKLRQKLGRPWRSVPVG
jgi:hypothetical protein